MNPHTLQAIDSRWQNALSYYRKKGHVLFISDRYRFWEEPGFVQQSLAKTLLESGVRVSWLDGMSWKRLNPSLSFQSPFLKVNQLKCLPGRRWSVLDRLSIVWQTKQIQSLQLKDNPLLWIQGSLDERICAELPNIDVFSAFDDAYLHSNGGVLAEKAKLIISQNQFCNARYQKDYPQKSFLSLPPVELNQATFGDEQTQNWIRSDFPRPILGYLGACFSEGYDFDLLQILIEQRPQWGFLIVGRTDEVGLKKIQKLANHSNFIYLPHLPRKELASIWKNVNVNLMLYRACRGNSGAFPVKLLEAAYFKVPSVATETPKTSSVKEWVNCSSQPAELLKLIEEELSYPKDQTPVFERLFYEMHPKVHLAKVAEALG